MLKAANKIRVAVVEDSALFRDRVECFLGQECNAFVVGAAATVSAAILLIHQQHPDLLLLDVLLEGGTGVAVLDYLRSADERIPVVIMTNAPSRELENCCFALGAEWCLDKLRIADAVPGICSEVALKTSSRIYSNN